MKTRQLLFLACLLLLLSALGACTPSDEEPPVETTAVTTTHATPPPWDNPNYYPSMPMYYFDEITDFYLYAEEFPRRPESYSALSEIPEAQYISELIRIEDILPEGGDDEIGANGVWLRFFDYYWYESELGILVTVKKEPTILPLDWENYEKETNESLGYSLAKQDSVLHHVVFESKEGFEITLSLPTDEALRAEIANSSSAELAALVTDPSVDSEYLGAIAARLRGE